MPTKDPRIVTSLPAVGSIDAVQVAGIATRWPDGAAAKSNQQPLKNIRTYNNEQTTWLNRRCRAKTRLPAAVPFLAAVASLPGYLWLHACYASTPLTISLTEDRENTRTKKSLVLPPYPSTIVITAPSPGH
jgi:hypothetical protein